MKCTVNCVVEYTYTMEIPEDVITESMEHFGATRDESVSRLAEAYCDVDDDVFDTLKDWDKCFEYAYTVVKVYNEKGNTVYSFSV